MVFVFFTTCYRIMHAVCERMRLGVFCVLMAGSGMALQPWDGTEASVNLLSKGEYEISVAENREYVITTMGKEVEASFRVVIPDVSATVTLRLRDVYLTKDGVVLQVEGRGTLRVVSEEGTSVLRRIGATAGEAVYLKNDGTLVFGGTKGASLWVFAQSGTSASSAISTNVVSASTAFGTVRMEGGELHVVAGGATSEAWIPAVISAKQVIILGGTLFVGVSFSAASTFSVSDLEGAWPSVLRATAGISFLGGTLASEKRAKPLPGVNQKFEKVNLSSIPTADGVATVMGGSSYPYPEEAFGLVQAVAQGGQVGEKAFLRFQTQGVVLAEALAKHMVSGATGERPRVGAVEVVEERGVVAVNVTECSELRFNFVDEGMAGAVELFGCIPTATEDAVRVDYAFWLSWIGPVRVEGEDALRVAVRAAVRLPQETAQSKTFKLSVSRTLEGVETLVFEGCVPFVRRLEKDTLYETALLLTSDSFAGDFGIYRYRVTATEAP